MAKIVEKNIVIKLSKLSKNGEVEFPDADIKEALAELLTAFENDGMVIEVE